MKIEEANILLVDDDPVMRLFICSLLKQLAVREVREATDGQAALLLLEGFSPDVVLSDLHMGRVDGPELVRRIRAHPSPALRKTPVVIMSADSRTSLPDDFALLGVAGYIAKPPSLAVLQLKLTQALKFR